MKNATEHLRVCMLIFIFVSGYIDYFFNPLFSLIPHCPAFPVALAKAAGPSIIILIFTRCL